MTVGFDTDPEGNVIEKGTYVGDEWSSIGLELFAEGGVGSRPRIFDTADPGGEKPSDCGDSDLGAPNKYCPGGGPGKGIGGEPGKPGENCEPLGNVLIVQEPGEDCPDDNGDGGLITLDFPAEGGNYVYEIGLLDVDYATKVVIVYEKSPGTLEEYEITVPLLGDNSYQTVIIDQANVKWIKVMFARSGAVTSITFCPDQPSPAPTPIGTGPEPTPSEPAPTTGTEPEPTPGTEPEPTPGTEPEPTPGTEPEPTPGTEPAPTPGTEPEPTPSAPVPTPEGGGGEPTPSGVCPSDLVTVGFDKDPEGNVIEKGTYVGDEWSSIGLELFAEGGVGSRPRIFDTADPGGEKPSDCGDSDLGAPNKYCPGGGPGQGIGGEPGKPGENCEPLGNALIVQEPGEDCPDDNGDGGIITLDFPAEGGNYVYEIGLLDVDYATKLVIVYEKSPGNWRNTKLLCHF